MDAKIEPATVSEQPRRKRRKVWHWILFSIVLGGAVLFVTALIVLQRAEPILKGRVIQALSARFNSRVELDDLRVSIFQGLQVSGAGLRIYAPDDVVAAGAKDPLFSVPKFQFSASIMGLFVKPMHVGVVHVQGLSIRIPPRSVRNAGQTSANHPSHHYKIKVTVDEFVCDDSQLVIGTDKPNKDPKIFVLKHIVLHDVGPTTPWPYDATLTNAIPRGNIHAVGTFGPWNTESPGDSGVTGRYTFDHAELNTIKGIGGMLSSTGSFEGQLNKIQAHGTATVPNFSLDTANHGMPLHTKFSVIVDGLSGDTYLQPVVAKLGDSDFTCRGAVVNLKGKGHTIDLDINVPAGHIEDFLKLAVKTEPPVMTGIIETKTHLHIPPGKESVSQKMNVTGEFHLTTIQFTRPAVQDKIDMLSMRAQGRPREAKPGAQDVSGHINGDFHLANGELNFKDLHYSMPGAEVSLDGTYTLDGRKFDFNGIVRTQAKLSEMVANPWKSLLLKAVDPFFSKHGAGVEVPVKVTGTNGEPKFGLNFGHKDDAKKAPAH